MSTSANTTVPSPPVRHQNPPLDEDEFAEKYENIDKVLKILYDLNVALAVIFGLAGVLLFLTILNRKLRSQSPVWYLYHAIVMSFVTALFIHTFIHAGISWSSRPLCFFVMYTAEFIFMAMGINLVLLNIEIYFTTVLPLQKWQWSPFFRFVISILSSWIAVLVISVYSILNFNTGLTNENYCFILAEKTPRTVRMVLRSVLPAGLCFLFTLVLIGTHCLKRSRFMITSASGELREVRTTTNEGEMEWTRVVVFMNIVFIARTILVLVINYSSLHKDIEKYVMFMGLLVCHATTFYILPLGMLFLSDARAVIKALIFKAIGLASCGKLRLGEDLEQLSVSFGQDHGTSVH